MERLHILIPLEREAPHSAASRSPVKLAANKSQGRSAISPQRCHVGAAGAVRGCDNGLEVKTAPHSNYTADLSHIVKTSHQRARWMGHGRCGIQSLCAVPVANRTTEEAGDSCFPLRRIYNSTYVRLTRRMSADDATRTTLIGEGEWWRGRNSPAIWKCDVDRRRRKERGAAGLLAACQECNQ